jgi:HTH-type transcriptional regulator/antitoxin HipB
MELIARTPKQVGDLIRRERRRQGLTQAELGARVQLRQATISKLEAGEPATQMRVLFDVLAALKLELALQPRSRADATDIEDLF